jgi:hypothetical protein
VLAINEPAAKVWDMISWQDISTNAALVEGSAARA